jgi:predicted metal-dependent hydrolase
VHSDGYRRGVELFNARNFYDAHEVWEDVWRETNGPEKKFLQGLIQVAVAFHHHSTGNVVGACSLLARARKNLAPYPENFLGIRVTPLLECMGNWRSSLLAGEPGPPFPRLDSDDVNSSGDVSQ